VTKTNPADGRSRVKAGFRDSGQFKKEYLDPNLASPDEGAKDTVGWTEVGIDARDARYWATIETPSGARSWIENRFTFREASSFKEWGFDLEDAITIRYMGIPSAEEAVNNFNFSESNRALFGANKIILSAWRLYGFTEEERDAFLDIGIKTPQEAKEYRAKYATK
jgi:hypothetical protein